MLFEWTGVCFLFHMFCFQRWSRPFPPTVHNGVYVYATIGKYAQDGTRDRPRRSIISLIPSSATCPDRTTRVFAQLLTADDNDDVLKTSYLCKGRGGGGGRARCAPRSSSATTRATILRALAGEGFRTEERARGSGQRKGRGEY